MYLYSLVEITHLIVEIMYLTVEIEYGAVECVLLYDHIYLYMDMYDLYDLCGVGHFHNRSCEYLIISTREGCGDRMSPHYAGT